MPFKSDEDRRAYQRARYAQLKRGKAGKAAGNPFPSKGETAHPAPGQYPVERHLPSKSENEGGGLFGRLIMIVIILLLIAMAYFGALIFYTYWS